MAVLVTCFSLSACGLLGPSKPNAKTCASDETIAGLLNVVTSNADNSILASSAQVDAIKKDITATLANATASEIDEKIAMVDCSGELALRLPPGLESPFLPKDGIVTEQIRYTVQVSADEKSLVYKIYGGERLVNAVTIAAVRSDASKRKSGQSAGGEPVPTDQASAGFTTAESSSDQNTCRAELVRDATAANEDGTLRECAGDDCTSSSRGYSFEVAQVWGDKRNNLTAVCEKGGSCYRTNDVNLAGDCKKLPINDYSM